MIEISVVMSLYNENENELKESISSILLQTYRNFEFIIVIDNPDNLKLIKIVKKYCELDRRIKVYINKVNLGLAKSLNKGIQKAKGKYIARMDGDDISFLTRLEKQYNYLENNKEVFLIGGMAKKIDENNKKIGYLRHPTSYEKIKKVIKYKTCFIHPSIFFRKEIFDKTEGYRNFPCSQDYDFISRIIDLGYKVENLNENLIKYRVRKNSITGEKRLFQILLAEYIQKLSKERKINKKDSFNEAEIKKIEQIYKKNNGKFIKINNTVLKYKDKKILFLIQIPWIYIKSKFYRKEINNRIKIFFSTLGEDRIYFMKKKIKKIIGINGYFYYLKLKELYMKLFINSNKKKEKYIKKQFKKKLGYEIDFEKELETFNQKIQFRKLYDNNPLYSICADKYRVREYVKEKIGEEYLIPLYLVTDKLTEEQWDKLPTSFVAKANHNSGPVQIVRNKNKVDKKKIIQELNNQLKVDYGIISMEKYYSDIPRKIIVEKFLEHNKETLEDFKFHVFNNKVLIEHIFQRTREGEVYENFYTEDWKKISLAVGAKNYNEIIEKPKQLNKMLEIAKKLSEDFNYVRVDLYYNNEKIFFGELTFCGDSGFGKFTNETWDYKLGSYWNQTKLK